MSANADKFSRLAALKPARSIPAQPATLRAPDEEDLLGQLLGAGVAKNHFGEHLAVRNWFPTPEFAEPSSAALELLSRMKDESLSRKTRAAIGNPAKWLFLDTETTGLAGGTGTYAFLVGLAWWDAGGLQAEQLFMRDFTEEYSLLHELAARIAERPVLFTFNGKSFDWPLLETRYRMTRSMTPPALRAHLDFLHPARNLWRLRLGSVRLSQLERHVLGWDRGHDLLSELIPSIYLNFVRYGHADPLVPVFQHNQMDLRGLAGLSGRILSLLGEETVSQDGLELYGVSRICERRGEVKRARKLYEQSIASTLPSETDRAARTALARLAKRDGDADFARELWESILGNSREGYKAYEQLAIHLEHKAREPRQALGIVRDALAQLRRSSQLGMIEPAAYRRSKAQFEHRLARLERKAGQTLLEAFDA